MTEKKSGPVQSDPDDPHFMSPDFDFSAAQNANMSAETMENLAGKMSDLEQRMTQFCRTGASPKDYEIALKIGDAARSALQILRKYASIITS